MSLFLIVALPFVGALLPGLMNQAGRSACAGITFTVTLSAFIGLLTNAPAVFAGEVVTVGVDWMPILGLNFNLMLDGLGFFFAMLILGIGLLIITYARYYLSRDDNMGEFFTYLLLFQGGDGWNCSKRQYTSFTYFLGAYVAFFIPVDRVLEAPSRRASGRADGADRDRYGRACDDRGNADPWPGRWEL